MKKILFLVFLLLLVTFLLYRNHNKRKWANLSHYKKENAKVKESKRDASEKIVFMGNSITEQWKNLHPEFFKDERFIIRGISGQVSEQMLLRFKSDVIDLKPEIVLILAGTNDIAENSGPISIDDIMNNITRMAKKAKAAKIQVILASVLPAANFPWSTSIKNVPDKIVALNNKIETYASENECIYLDYYSAMVANDLSLKSAYTYDGVHPNKAGYEVMAPLAKKAIQKAFTSP